MVLGLTFKTLTHLSCFCVWCKIKAQFYSFEYRYPVSPMPLIEGTILSPLCVLGAFVER